MSTLDSRILDASAMLALLRNEAGAQAVANLLNEPAARVFAHAINLCEVYYRVLAREGETRARESIERLEKAGVQPRPDLDPAFWQEAGQHKVTIGHASLADCICVALARRLRGELVTADHPDFDAVAQRGLCQVLFIR